MNDIKLLLRISILLILLFVIAGSTLQAQTDQPFRIKTVDVYDINSAGGVDFYIVTEFLPYSKDIKYITFTVVPYNRVGDRAKCEINGYDTTYQGKVTGPIELSEVSKSYTRSHNWSTAWYNNTISCIKITRIQIDYMDGTHYTYVKELPLLYAEGFTQCK